MEGERQPLIFRLKAEATDFSGDRFFTGFFTGPILHGLDGPNARVISIL
jgi:hypothetical protein